MKSNNNIYFNVHFLTLKNLPFIINNWYFKTYCRVVENAKNQNRVKLKKSDPQYVYFESHHIKPKKLGGSNDNNNLVLFNKYEHFLAHWLLTKCIGGSEKYQMMFAFDKMLGKNKNQDRYIPKHKFVKIIKNNRVNLKHSEETKQKMKKAYAKKSPQQKALTSQRFSEINSGSKNPMYNKSVYDVWLEKHGEEEANKKYENWINSLKKSSQKGKRRNDISERTKGENNPRYKKISNDVCF